MKKIFFIISSLGGGGAERVLINILRHIDRTRFNPSLVLLVKEGEYLPFLPPDINTIVLRSRENVFFLKLLDVPRLARLLKAEKPTAVLSLMWYTNTITLLARLAYRGNIRTIVSERTSTFSYEGFLMNLMRSLAIRFLYPKSDIVIAPSDGIRKILGESYGIPEKKIEVINNPLDTDKIHEESKEELEHPWYKEGAHILVSAGRLGKEKGFSYLIKAVSILSKKNIRCKLIILGEGNERNNLQNLTKKLAVNDRVALLGFKKNPYKYLSRSTVFVLSSLYEGFPNVLLEAMASGVPSIATNCPTGPDEIITDGVNGILVPPADEYALADAIQKLLEDENLRMRLAETGRRRAEDFRAEKIVKQYEDVIDKACAESAAG